MKNIALIFFLFITFNSFAQKPAYNFLLGELKYSAEDSVVTDTKNNTIHLYGKADFKYGQVHFKAEEVIIDRNTKNVIATGLIAIVSVPAVRSSASSTNKILRYTMGEAIVAVE